MALSCPQVVTLDYVGIFVMIFGSFFSGLYFEFYCLHMERIIYQSTIAALCIAGAVLTFSPYFHQPKVCNPGRLIIITCR